MWPILHSLIQSAPNANSNSFALDITLQIMTHLLDSLDSLSILMDGATADEQDDDKHSTIPYQYQCLLSTIWKNFEHSDSTVRQSASQAMLSLLRCCAKTTEQPSTTSADVDSITNEVFSTLSDILKRNSHADWAALETALLVSEDVIWTSLTLSLTIQQKETEREVFDLFCSSLQGALSRSLLHNAFEIRRMGTQLLPLYVRYVCIRNPLAVTDAIKSVNVEADEGESGSLVVVLLGLIWCVEFAKSVQHFVEVSFIEKMANDPNNEDNEAFQPWILDMPGRLAETRKRTEFHRLLRRSMTEADTSALLSTIQCIVPMLSEQVHTLYNQWIAGMAGLEGQHIVSTDVAEALALCYAVLSSYHELHLCNDSITYITEKVAIAEKPVLLSVDAWMQTPSLLLAKVMKGSVERDGVLLPSLIDPACAPEVLSILLPLEGLSSADNKSNDDDTESATKGRISTASSINRWLCEAICPVMPILVKHVAVSISPPKYWTAILISWAFHVIKDPLWLDRKPLVRKHIFDALMVLTQAYALDNGNQSNERERDADASIEMNGMLKHLLSAMTLLFQSMCVNHRPIAVEAYEMNCLVSSMHRIIKDSDFNGTSSNNSLLVSFKTVLTKAQEKVNNMLQLMGSINSGLISPQKSPKNVGSPHGSGGVFLFPPAVEASVEGHDGDKGMVLGKNSTSKPAMVVDIPTTEPLEEVQEDEFSDWDEDSDDDLNTSASSVRSQRKDADEEVNNLLECVEEALQYANSVNS